MNRSGSNSIRWYAVVGLVAAALVTGCAHAPTTAVGATPTVVLPGTVRLVAQWREDGGFTAPADIAIRAPRLSVYSDGSVVADAEHTLTLSGSDTAALVGRLRLRLDQFGATVTPDGKNMIADAATDVLVVLDANGRAHSVSAYALSEGLHYPGALVAAGDELRTLWQRVSNEGTAYSSTRVRLIASRAEPSGGVVAWPDGVPLPVFDSTAVFAPARQDLSGDAAVAVTRTWPHTADGTPRWPLAALPDGSVVQVAWRFLLIDE